MKAADSALHEQIDPRDLKLLLQEVIYNYAALSMESEEVDKKEVKRHLYYLREMERELSA